MLIRQGAARNDHVDRRLACTLAGTAGALNTAAFHAVGFFSANMTGNVSSASNALAGGHWLTALFYLLIVCTFIVGAGMASLMIHAGRRRGIHGIYALGILAESVLMALLACAELALSGPAGSPVLVLGLSFLMGLQNAVGTHISDGRVRTTHVSGMSTDIGIESAVLLDILRGREPLTQRAAQASKLRLHVYTLLSFLAGGVIGVVVYQISEGLLLFGAAALLLSLAIEGLVSAHRVRAQHTPME